jgi:N-methylhydantoinase A
LISFACDVGGTFTDLVVANQGRLFLYKSPTIPDDPVAGVLAALDLGAAQAGQTRESFLAAGDIFVHATTRAINAMLIGATARTAFLTTEGHRDILLLREGGRLNPYDNAVEFPRPYVSRALTFEVPGRIGAGGEEVIPLDERAVMRIAAQLADAKIEAIGVCLLWSIANPAHEQRVAEILAAQLPNVPVTLSHRLNPIVREYRRASATCIDASLKPLMGAYLRDLKTRLSRAGFAGRLLMVTSQGGVIDAAAAAAAPIHTLNSGPSMAPVAGRRFARDDANGVDAIITDAGGTSFDVSLVRGGRAPSSIETWIGGRFTGHMTGFPSVDVRSIGAGGGSIAYLDSGGLLHVGPESAGADPGPVCYGLGGTRPTVTDCVLALGYLDPGNFLGGRMELNQAAARNALKGLIAQPLGVSVEEAALAVLDLLTQNMVAAIEEITINQGIDPRRAILVAGGGAAGFNAAAIARRLGCRAALLPQIGAALSAAGAMMSDLVFTDGRVCYLRSDAPDYDAAASTMAELSDVARRILAANQGAAEARIEFWVEARYPQQIWEIEVPITSESFDPRRDLPQLVRDFHAAHERLYAVADSASPVEIIAWRMRASLRVRDAPDTRIERLDEQTAPARRRIYLRDGGWAEAPVHRFSSVPPSSPLIGPAIIETAFTTIFVPRGASARRLPSGSIELTEDSRS